MKTQMKTYIALLMVVGGAYLAFGWRGVGVLLMVYGSFAFIGLAIIEKEKIAKRQ